MSLCEVNLLPKLFEEFVVTSPPVVVLLTYVVKRHGTVLSNTPGWTQSNLIGHLQHLAALIKSQDMAILGFDLA